MLVENLLCGVSNLETGFIPFYSIFDRISRREKLMENF